ncbi:MAG: hypothetical protein V2A53_01995 [bacterium]
MLKAQAQGFLSEASNVFDANLIALLIKELAKKSIPLEKDPKLKNLQQDLSLQMADRAFLSLVHPVRELWNKNL